MLDLRTEREIETANKKARIYALFDQIDSESGHQFSTWRICIKIAETIKDEWETSPHNIYAYIKKSGRCSMLDRTRYVNPLKR